MTCCLMVWGNWLSSREGVRKAPTAQAYIRSCLHTPPSTVYPWSVVRVMGIFQLAVTQLIYSQGDFMRSLKINYKLKAD